MSLSLAQVSIRQTGRPIRLNTQTTPILCCTQTTLPASSTAMPSGVPKPGMVAKVPVRAGGRASNSGCHQIAFAREPT